MTERSDNNPAESMQDRLAKRKASRKSEAGDYEGTESPITDALILKCAAIVTTVCFVVYMMTVAREPMFGDGFEFMAAAASGGVPHPTGYPLLMLLLGPFSGSYFSGAVLCSVFAAITAGLLTILTGRLLTPSLVVFKEEVQIAIISAIGLVMGLGTSLWYASGVVEVYTLNAMLLSAALVVLFAKGDGAGICWRQLSIVALIASFGAGNHLTIGCLIFIFAARLIQSLVEKHTKPVHLPLIIICGVLPFVLLYGSLMMKASASPPINWGNPENIEGIQWILRGGDYSQTQFMMEDARTNTSFTTATYVPFFFERLVTVLNHLGTQFLGPLQSTPETGLDTHRSPWNAALLMGLLFFTLHKYGMVLLLKKKPVLAIGYGLTVATYAVFVFTYNIIDIADYFLALFVLMLPGMLIGLNELITFVVRKMAYDHPDRQIRLPVFIGLLVLVAFTSNFKEANQSRKISAENIIEDFEEFLPQNSIVISHADTDTYGLWFMQEVEDERRDVLVVAANFMRYDWYQSMLPAEGEDAQGRYVEVAPGDFRTFTAEDQYAMIRNNIIEPNIDSVPIAMTDNDPLMLRYASTEYDVVPLVSFVPSPEILEAYIEQHYTTPPSSLFVIQRKNIAPAPEENP